MLDSLKNCQPQTYAAMRIVAGFLFLWHGAQKLVGFPAPAPDVPALLLYVPGPIELIGGTMIMLGLFTRPVAFLASGLMAAAYFRPCPPACRSACAGCGRGSRRRTSAGCTPSSCSRTGPDRRRSP